MLRRANSQKRRGATLVEAAIVYSVLFQLLIGMIVGGLGVFRYQQVASLAREGARYASVRGTQYATNTGIPPTLPATDPSARTRTRRRSLTSSIVCAAS